MAGSGGGGIFNAGTLTLTYSTVRGNKAYSGGGIDNAGTLTLTRSTVHSNTATNFGGGLLNGAGTVTLRNSTLSGNTADYGGGIWNLARLALYYSTLSGNAAHSGAGGLYAGHGPLSSLVTIQSSILAGNTVDPGTGPDCVVAPGGRLSSQGYNLVGENTGCPLQAAGDRTVAPAD